MFPPIAKPVSAEVALDVLTTAAALARRVHAGAMLWRKVILALCVVLHPSTVTVLPSVPDAPLPPLLLILKSFCFAFILYLSDTFVLLFLE